MGREELMDIEEMKRKITTMQEEINAAAYVIKRVIEDINELKGVIEVMDDDRK